MSDYCVKISKENPIAVVMGGKYNDKKISIVKNLDAEDEDENEEDERDPLEQFDISEFVTNLAIMPIEQRMKIVKGLKSKEDTTSKYSKRFKESCKKEFKIDSGEFLIYPTEKTERIFIAGKSESGKSWIASMYIREYREMFPDRKLILFSTHTDEKAYSAFDMVQIALDDEFIANPPTLDDLRDALIVFDDTDNMTDKKLQNTIKAVNDNLIANGRKYNIHCLTLAHQLMDYSRTRHLLNEANRVIFFIGSAPYHTKRYLKVYAGLGKEQIDKITKLKSRWVCLGLTLPNYYVSQHEIGVL